MMDVFVSKEAKGLRNPRRTEAYQSDFGYVPITSWMAERLDNRRNRRRLNRFVFCLFTGLRPPRAWVL